MMRGGEEAVFRHSFVDHEIAVAFTRIRRENENAESFSRREILALVAHIPRGDVADDFGSDNGVLPEQREDTAVDGKVECKRVRRPVRLQFRELLHEGIQKNIRKMPVGRN